MYNYEVEKHSIFTEEGQRIFLSVRDRVEKFLRLAGAVRMQEAIKGEIGDSWKMLACVDRLVELGEIKEITEDVAGQNRVFIAARTKADGLPGSITSPLE